MANHLANQIWLKHENGKQFSKPNLAKNMIMANNLRNQIWLKT